MIQKIELFVLVLSIIFCLQFLVKFVLLLTQDNPEPMNTSTLEKIFLYLTSSYIVTAIITFITTK
jgi:hypothetical protein